MENWARRLVCAQAAVVFAKLLDTRRPSISLSVLRLPIHDVSTPITRTTIPAEQALDAIEVR